MKTVDRADFERASKVVEGAVGAPWLFRLVLEAERRNLKLPRMTKAINVAHKRICRGLKNFRSAAPIIKPFEGELAGIRGAANGMVEAGEYFGASAHAAAIQIVEGFDSVLNAPDDGTQLVGWLKRNGGERIGKKLKALINRERALFVREKWGSPGGSPGGAFSPMESTALATLDSAGRPMKGEEIAAVIEAKGQPVSLGSLKTVLAGLVRREVLHNIRGKGYARRVVT